MALYVNHEDKTMLKVEHSDENLKRRFNQLKGLRFDTFFNKNFFVKIKYLCNQGMPLSSLASRHPEVVDDLPNF